MPLNLDYFYGNEAEQYSFYRIPKVLFTDKRYKCVAVESKVLYGLMLDRMGLSIRNGWLDSNGRVFIYFTLDDAMDQMSCGHNKAVKLFSDLSQIGLIERVKQGQGRPTRIYVKNFVLPINTEPSAMPPHSPEQPEAEKKAPASGPESPPANLQTSDLGKSETPHIEEVPALEGSIGPVSHKGEVLTSEKGKSAIPENGNQDFRKADANNTKKKDTERSKTDLSSYPPSPVPPLANAGSTQQGAGQRRMRVADRKAYRELIEDNLDYPELLRAYPYDDEIIDGYVELMVDICASRREFIRINQEDIPTEVVKSRFLKLTSEHISYVLDSLKDNTTKIGNIKAYTLTALYNAPTLMSQYYASRASHDIAHGGSGNSE